jgi:predicted PurR-regulated permease PerM
MNIRRVAPFPGRTMTDAQFIKRIALAVLIIAIAVAVWRLREVILLAFCALLIALLLHAAANQLQQRVRIARPLALILAGLAMVVVTAALIAAFVLRLQGEVAELSRRLPAAWQKLQTSLAGSGVGRQLLGAIDQAATQSGHNVLPRLRAYFASAGQAVVDIILVVVAGIYLTAQPELYRRGLLRLAPDAAGDRIRLFINQCGARLRMWLLAQVAAMVTIGLMVAGGLAVLGIPAWEALGLFAGLAEFIPLFGPFIAAVPALIVAFGDGPMKAVEVTAMFLGVHLIEANLLQPWLQRRLAALPPVISVFALAVFGVLFGLLGVILAAPLAIASLTAIRVFYLNDPLKTDERA